MNAVGRAGPVLRAATWSRLDQNRSALCLQETYGRLLNVEKHQDRLRAKGLLIQDMKTMKTM